IKQTQALPAMDVARAAGGPAATAPKPAWEAPGFDPVPSPLPIAEVSCDPEPTGRYAPVAKLFDGLYAGSTNSVMWAPGKTAVVNVALVEETRIRSVVLREWHMFENWAVKDRKLEISSDGFQKDIRLVPGAFADAGTQSWGSNVNSIFELPVGLQGKHLRLTFTPANEQSSVYVAEVEILGLRAGQSPQITALAAGNLNGDGPRQVVIGGALGQVRALDATGKTVWEYATKERARLNSLACADVNGDGRDEVMFGQDGEKLGLLSSAGKLLWTAQPPRFRGIASDVMTVFPGDVTGDGRPEIICGVKSWQYFAYDAAGQQLWGHVIYAHAATVGCAADLDADGKQEIVAGDVYYTLNVIDHDGTRLWRSGNVGPEITAVAAADVTGDGRPEVFTGVDGGTLYANDATGKLLWELNLGDKITRMLPLDVDGDGKQELICAAESACVFAVDGAGKIVWRAGLPDGCADLALLTGEGGPKLIASCGAAGVAVIAKDGKIEARHALLARAESLVLVGNQAVVTESNGQVAAVKLP
ncbi:MAG: VCBS repeat-containing protein, partial [Armatimonadetes bacterium]|nr:VCBS repeat-containing protein [Armatimonadota bacterium]